MKQEEMSDISTILIEATDERSAVMDQVSKQTKPVIIVLPEQADQIFRQPGDFFELKRIKRERGLSITLVISGHERIRNMARRQGFQVYTSAETCVRAMARRDRLYTMRGISLPGTTAILPAGTDLSCPPFGTSYDSPDTINRSLRGDSGDESDDDVPWSYSTSAEVPFIASAIHQPAMQGDEQSDDAPPWSYDVQMSQARPGITAPKNAWRQGDEQSGDDDDVPWSYDVQMNQANPPAETPPQRTTWMLSEEELWSQQHQSSTQRERYQQSYTGQLPNGQPLAGHPYAGYPQGVSLPYTNQYSPASPNYAPAGETPIPPCFTETLENLIAISGEKLGNPHPYMVGAPLAGALPAYAPQSDASGTGMLGIDTHNTRRLAQPVRYAPNTEPLYPVPKTRPLQGDEQASSRFALMLTALLILGILGGVGCGYALSLMHVNLTVLTSMSNL
jgi:hypothetical protein